MIPDSFKQDLLNRVDVVDVVSRYVQLRKGGANFLGLCPFHSEKSASFTVSPAKQFYHCFGCGAHGDSIGFLMAYAGLGYVDAVRELAASVGMQLPETRPRTREEAARMEREVDLYALLEQAMNFYRGELKNSRRAIDYLKGRGLTGEIAARFRVGYAPDDWQALRAAFPEYENPALVEAGLVIENEGKRYDRFRDRVLFPILSNRGAVIGFGGRVLGDGEPKYLNSPETPVFEKGRELYGIVQAREAIRLAGRALVVEGYMDVISLAQHGVGYAVATLGTATTPSQVSRLLRLADEVVFCFDGDAAGRKAAWRALEVSLPLALDHKPIRFLFLPQGDDPDTHIRAHGAEAFERAVREAQTLSGFLLAELRAPADLATPEGRSGLLSAARPHLQRTEAPALRLQLVKEIATLARVSQEEAEQLLGLAAPSAPRRSAPRRAAPPIAATQERNLLRCVLVNPALVRDLEAELLDTRMPESAALQAIAESAVDGGAMSVAVLIDRFRDSVHAEVLYQAQASALEQGLSDDDAERQFRQIQLALRIQRRHEEFDALKREVADGRASRDLMLELDRRAKELAELKSQRL